jgi:hypothetical protein
MSRPDGPSRGWFYKQAGETLGPVSGQRLRELLGLGLLRPRQAVWAREGQDLLFVPAAAAASGTAGHGLAPPSSSPASA